METFILIVVMSCICSVIGQLYKMLSITLKSFVFVFGFCFDSVLDFVFVLGLTPRSRRDSMSKIIIV